MYSIAIHLNDSLVSIGVSDPNTGIIISVEQYQLEVEASQTVALPFLTSGQIKDLLSHSDSNTVYSCSSRFTIIPSVFFDKNALNEISSPIFTTFENEQLFSQFIPEIDSHLIFPFTSTFNQKLKSEIGHTEIAHHFGSLISTYHLYYLKDNTDMAFVHYHENKFTLGLFKGKKMVLFNVFELNSYEDVIYYTYYSMEQFEFKPADTAIHIGGFFENNQAVTTAFQKYTTSIFQLSPTQISTIDTQISDKITSTIFDLQCG